MAKLTKERIEWLLAPGRIFQKNGTLIFLGDISEEEQEDISAAYRIGFLKEDIDSVIAEVNAKRSSSAKTPARQRPRSQKTPQKTQKDEQNLVNIFGHALLKDVILQIKGTEIHIGSVQL